MNFDIKYIENLAKVLNDNNLSEISLQNESKSLTIKKSGEFVNIPQAVIPQNIVSQTEKAESDNNSDEEKKESGKPLTSPLLGTFYSAPSPKSPAFVKEGDTIEKGQVICIVEAMKLMNKVEAEFSGKITKICVNDGDTVEYGQVLMYVE